MDIRRIFEYALQREQEGLRFFSEYAQRGQRSSAAGVFQQLVNEEQAHIAFIERLLSKITSGEEVTADSVAEETMGKAGWFEQRARSENIEQRIAEEVVPDLAALRMAYLIEQDLADFYRQSASGCEGKARDAFELLARWETEHARLFKALHDRAYNVYMQMPWGG